MIWNLSEEDYDYSYFNNNVLEFKFPGHPAPPLGLMIKICTSIENWLEADSENVAIIHCLTGKGRTATMLACVLSWLGLDAPKEPDSPLLSMEDQGKETHDKNKEEDTSKDFKESQQSSKNFENVHQDCSISPREALTLIAEKMNVAVDTLTIPSQRRYLQYFTNMMDGVKPRSNCLILKKVVMSTIPKFSKIPSSIQEELQEKEKVDQTKAYKL